MHAYKVFAFCAVAGLIAAADASATFTWLPANFVANGVSKDGRIIVGQDTTTNTAAYCFQGSVVDLSGADVGSSANACSRHGEIIAGRSGSGMPFYWSSATGFQLLPLKSGFTSGRATVVSADASTIGGDCTYVYDSQYYGSSPADSAVVWRAPNWSITPLDPEDGAHYDANGGQGLLKSISDDGSFIAGELDYVWIKVFPGSLNTTNFDMYENRGAARGFDGRYYLNRNRFFGCVQFNAVIYKRGNTGYTRTVFSDTFSHRASQQAGDDATETAAMAMTGDARSIFACSYYMQSDEYDGWPIPRLMDAEGVFTFRHISNGQRPKVGDSTGFEARACTDDGQALFGRITLGHYNGAPFDDLYSFAVGNKAVLNYRNLNADLVSLLNSQGANVPAGSTLFGNPIYCSSDGSVLVGSGRDALQHTMSWLATLSSDPVSISLAPDTVQGAQNASAYVLFNQAVYPSGPQIAVKISSDNPAVVPNGDFLIDPAADFEAFKFPTNPVSQDTLVHLTFQAVGKAIKLPLLVTQGSSSTPDLLTPTFNPQVVGGGADGACTIHFATNLPASGAMVFLRSSDTSALGVPLTVFVPGGASSATFKAKTFPVSAPTVKSLVAAYGSTIRTGVVTIVPASLFSITPSSPSVIGGNMGSATVRFNGLFASPQEVDLSSSNANVLKTPSSQNSDGHTFAFSFATTAVDSDTPVTIAGTCKTVTKTCSELVKAATLLSAAPASTTVSAGTWAKVNVRLNGPCGPSGGTVSFVSSDPGTVYVPKSAAFPAGQSAASFSILAVNASSSPVQVTVGYRGQTYSFNVQVQ